MRFKEFIGNNGLNLNLISNFFETILQSRNINFAFELINAGAVIPIKL